MTRKIKMEVNTDSIVEEMGGERTSIPNKIRGREVVCLEEIRRG